MVVALSDAYALHAQTGSGVSPDSMVAVTTRLTERELGIAPGALGRGARTD